MYSSHPLQSDKSEERNVNPNELEELIFEIDNRIEKKPTLSICYFLQWFYVCLILFFLSKQCFKKKFSVKLSKMDYKLAIL